MTRSREQIDAEVDAWTRSEIRGPMRRCEGRGGPCDCCLPGGRARLIAENNERERQRCVVRRARWQWFWWVGAWVFPLLILGGVLTLWALRRGRVKYADPAPWVQDATPMLLVYLLPLTVGTILYSMFT